MTVHLSARLAWHMEGWNGRVCRDPAANTFCVGHHSYPGDQIRVSRDLDWEVANAGASCSRTDGMPPCVYSVNAFGKETIGGYADAPDWYPANERVTWDLAPSTVCIWPFEQMYRPEVKNRGRGQHTTTANVSLSPGVLQSYRGEPKSGLLLLELQQPVQRG